MFSSRFYRPMQPQELIPHIANQMKVEWSLSTRKASGCVWFDQPPLTPGVVGRATRYPLIVDVALSSRYVASAAQVMLCSLVLLAADMNNTLHSQVHTVLCACAWTRTRGASCSYFHEF